LAIKGEEKGKDWTRKKAHKGKSHQNPSDGKENDCGGKIDCRRERKHKIRSRRQTLASA